MRNALKVVLFGGGPTFNGNPYSFYSLLDIFSDDRAAGAVNGTLPIAGGARAVTDGNSRLSIAGGVASFATGGVGLGDPKISYGSVVAAMFGRTILGTLSHTAAGYYFGWNYQASGQPILAFSLVTATRLDAYNGLGTRQIATVAAGTSYQLALVQRAAGAGGYFFIKGGAFANWTLLFGITESNVSYLPSLAVSYTTAVFTADNIRVPVSLYTVPYLAYDTFTRSDGALGSTETTGPDGQAGTARAWTDRVGTWGVASNAAQASALSGGIAYATAPCASADVLADVAFTRSAGSGGLILRYTDANNYLRATHDGTNCLLEQVVAGTPTTLRTGVATYAAGAVIRVILSGTTGLLFYNGAAVGAAFTVPASSATDHGLYTTDTGNTLDVFQALARGTGGEYAGLDAF